MNAAAVVYIVDDEPEVLKAITRALFNVNVKVEAFTSPSEALNKMAVLAPSAIISDQRMPFMSGHELLKSVASLYPECKRVMLSAHQDFEQVIEGFNSGAIQYFLTKPWVNKELFTLVSSFFTDDSHIQTQENNAILGNCEKIQLLKDKIKNVAGANVPICIFGETGTGKELVANACHLLSHRCNDPFIAFNCANLSEHLLESQLFGHKKGAFTGADKAHEGLFTAVGSGTLFLDEITTMPMNLQAKLLRVIQEREFTPLGSNTPEPLNAQILSASSKSLQQATSDGEFRVDLFYRLAVIKLIIPRLAQRDDDSLMLAEHFLAIYQQQYQKDFRGFEESAAAFILRYPWPGNVRQLQNVIHQISIMSQGGVITKAMIEEAIGEEPLVGLDSQNKVESQLKFTEEVDETLEEIEKRAILAAIKQCGGNVNQAAVKLAVNPSTIYRKLQKWGIEQS